MNRNIPNNFLLYDTSYGNEIPAEQLFIIFFDEMPSKQVDSNIYYDVSLVDEFKKMDFVEESRVYCNNRRLELQSQILFTNKKTKQMVRINGTTDKNKDNLLQLEFIFSIKNGTLEEQYDLDRLKKFQRQKKKSNIKLVKSDMGHLDTEDYDLLIPQINLELNYGKEFIKIHDTIVEKLNKTEGKGIILLHGDPGTGKTSYIKYLTSLVKEKDILFIPPSMAETLSDPSIIPFLMEHKNSILVIEDAERVISDRENNGSPEGVSNILNLTDGILGDCLSIQIVATFNMKREKIDPALLRKGRLIAEHKFEKLSINDTEKLLRHLKKERTIYEGMYLADIYNIDVEVFKSDKTKKIGFT